MLRVGLTGGIGSGKSMVAARLARCGAAIIDSDRVAREVVEPGSAGLRAVVDEFGTGILGGDGRLDRSALAARVFGDGAALGRLNAIVHPLVAARSQDLIATAPRDAIVVQDVPLLVENDLATRFPLVIVIHADVGVRLRRLIDERGMAPADAKARIAAQTGDERRRAVADVWIDNNGSREQTLATVDRLWAQRLVPFEANLRLRRPAARDQQPVMVAPTGDWPDQAIRMIARIAAVAGERARRIDHIGSTSVAGLDAKDVLDVQVVLGDLATATRLAEELVSAGLLRRDGRWSDNARDGTIWDKAMTTNADPARAVNCHLRPTTSPAWREAVLFRDWLRAHPAGVRQYAQLKHRLAGRSWDSIEDYTRAKTPFVASALDRAERWALRTGWRVS